MAADVKAIPDGFCAVTAHLVVDGAAGAIEFYKKAFGAEELHRMPAPDGKRLIHAAIRIRDSIIMLVDAFPEFGNKDPKALAGTPVTLHFYCEDADAMAAQAVAAGATETMAVADAFWGDRYGQVTDPYGHIWSIATHVRDVTPEEMAEAARSVCNPPE